jgi:hypothetical protein
MRTVIENDDELNKVINKEAWERFRLMQIAQRAEQRRREDEADCCLLIFVVPCFILFMFFVILDIMTG